MVVNKKQPVKDAAKHPLPIMNYEFPHYFFHTAAVPYSCYRREFGNGFHLKIITYYPWDYSFSISSLLRPVIFSIKVISQLACFISRAVSSAF